MIDVTEAKALVEKAVPGRDRAEADTLSAAAIDWAIKNLIGRTEARIRTYAMYGKTAIAVKIAPGVKDREGSGNSFYSDLVAESNTEVADAIADLINGREQTLLSPIQTARILNTYNARTVKFVRSLRQLGFTVKTGDEPCGNARLDNSTIVVMWE
ncbi:MULTISPECIES: hypothetical protein [Atopobiaceae]|jgi:hypothetical protein|uniref:hypothetical protein n=1 Tax=Atopobiaceae TaxID=1643824 RepID=UPI00034EBA5B|nr:MULTISPECIES: hypothetical protein [Atopobiaceae]EPD77387.1 hypothetical protein HMPREF1527_01320 [Atopobium sp. oral taxon 199 str. F0494]